MEGLKEYRVIEEKYAKLKKDAFLAGQKVRQLANEIITRETELKIGDEVESLKSGKKYHIKTMQIGWGGTILLLCAREQDGGTHRYHQFTINQIKKGE
jgi:hypothetical protein